MRRRPRHAAKRARRRLHLTTPAPAVSRLRRALPAPRAVVASLWARHRAALTPERRRARTMVAAAVGFAAIIVLTSFPVSELLSQRSALSSTARQLTSMQAANRVLAQQAAALGAAGVVNALARDDYGFVAKGERVYDILPPPGSAVPTSTGSGRVPLDAPPVVPGSARSQALMGLVTPPATADAHGGSPGAGPARGADPPRGYWARVLRSLEFWN